MFRISMTKWWFFHLTSVVLLLMNSWGHEGCLTLKSIFFISEWENGEWIVWNVSYDKDMYNSFWVYNCECYSFVCHYALSLKRNGEVCAHLIMHSWSLVLLLCSMSVKIDVNLVTMWLRNPHSRLRSDIEKPK